MQLGRVVLQAGHDVLVLSKKKPVRQVVHMVEVRQRKQFFSMVEQGRHRLLVVLLMGKK
jgi:hypothetical protein